MADLSRFHVVHQQGVRTQTHTHARTHTRTHARTHTRTPTHTHIRTRSHTPIVAVGENASH